MSCIDGKGLRTFCGKEECLYHYEKSFASFQGMCCGASDSKECEENKCNCCKKKVDCWDQEKNEGIMPYMVSKGTDAKAWFLCLCGNSWNPTISRITGKNGSWCPPCGIKKSTNKNKITKEQVIERAKKIHNKENCNYDYSKVVYTDYHTDIIVICLQNGHGEFKVIVSGHLYERQPTGCPKCGREKTIKARSLISIKGIPQIKWTLSYFITEATRIHQNQFNYSKVDIKSYITPVIIICTIHGEFLMKPVIHIRNKCICPKCAIEQRSKKHCTTINEFIIRAKIKHENKYNYDSTIYIKNGINVEILCYQHGIFTQNPNDHLRGNGCPKCGIIQRSLSQALSQEEYITRCKTIHGETIEYSKVNYVTNDSIIELYCTKHKVPFTMKASAHLYGKHSCRKCSYSRMSKVAREWLTIIQFIIPELQTYDSNKGEHLIKTDDFYYFADGYNPLTKTIYEFHGSFWHGDPSIYSSEMVNNVTGTTMGELYQKTQEKKRRCIDLGYNYVEIWESQWYRFKKVIRMCQLQFRKRKSNPI
jgi:hypothetical protein